MKQRAKKSIFVIMPFTATPARTKEDLTEFFQTNLKERIEGEASLKYQYIVSRSDDTFDITAQIIRDLYRADIVICDLSGHYANPNVMYELGVRLALSNKPVVLIREKHADNKPIFDIGSFYAYQYSPQQYRVLEDHIVDKLRKFESEDEVFESPVLKVLKTEPTVIREINRARVQKVLDSLRVEVVGLQRLLGGALDDFFSKHGITPKFQTPKETLAFIEKHRKKVEGLPWDSFVFVPHSMPAMAAFLVELPLADLLEEKLTKEVNTFVNEYYNHFLACDYTWRPATFSVVHRFLGESHYFRQILAGCLILISGVSDSDAKKTIKAMREFMSDSTFK